MSLFSRLTSLFLPADAGAASPEVAERVAVAALLLHVARIDGTVSDAERRRLDAILGERFGPGIDAPALLERGGELDYESGDIGPLIDMLGHDAPPAERARLLSLAWDVATSDGTVHEFEEGVLWRLARALGLGDEAVRAAREASPRAAR